MTYTFADRQDAGKRLAEALNKYAKQNDVFVLGLPRGGIPVAVEVANRLSTPLDALVVSKLDVPGHDKLAMGAIADGGAQVLNYDLIESLSIEPEIIAEVIENKSRELYRREKAYRSEKPFPNLVGKTVILVDDGLATGITMKAAIRCLKQYQPEKIVVGLPVGSVSACQEIIKLVDEFTCLLTPPEFNSIGYWYEEFAPVSDEEVRRLIEQYHLETAFLAS